MPLGHKKNRRYVSWTTALGLFFIFPSTPGYTEGTAATGGAGYRLPHFRDAEDGGAAPSIAGQQVFQLLGDQDFAPFSFASQTGPSGLAVEMALAACAEAKITCQVTLLPFKDLLPALAERRGDVVISGPRIDEAALKTSDATRPYFRTLGRFAVQSGSTLGKANAADMNSKRIGAVKATSHEAWLVAHFTSSEIVAFDTPTAAQEALRTGGVDAIFGDNLQIIYWMAGEASQKCCRILDGAFSDSDFFSRNIAFFVRNDRPDLRAALDFGLDQLQTKGTTDAIFNRYVPLPPW